MENNYLQIVQSRLTAIFLKHKLTKEETSLLRKDISEMVINFLTVETKKIDELEASIVNTVKIKNHFIDKFNREFKKLFENYQSECQQ